MHVGFSKPRQTFARHISGPQEVIAIRFDRCQRGSLEFEVYKGSRAGSRAEERACVNSLLYLINRLIKIRVFEEEF